MTYGRGVDVAFDAVGGDTTVQTFQCMGFNGRHLIAGFSEDIQLEDANYLTPRPMAYGNFSLVRGLPRLRRTTRSGPAGRSGFNWPSALGGPGRARDDPRDAPHRPDPDVGDRELAFGEIPAALEAMERRETVGRLVATMRR